MDPLTRREAEKIEEVLADLVDDLELVSCLPEEFNLWLRDDALVLVDKFTTQQLPELLAAGGVDACYSASDPALAGEREELLEELQRLCKADCFLHAAEQYGDPADTAGNEALLQLGEFSEVEHDLLETATTVGHLDDDDVDFHHLSLRALLDTLREGEYMSRMRSLLHTLYPASASISDGVLTSITSSLRADSVDEMAPMQGEEGDGALQRNGPRGRGGGKMPFDRKAATTAGMVDEAVESFADTIRTLTRLIHLRNASTVNEDVHRYKVLREAVNKEQSATADVQALNREFNAVKAARRKEVAALDAEIERLEAEIAYVCRAADVELEAMNEVNEKVRADRASTYRHQLEQHREAAVTLEEKFRQLEAQHAEDASGLRTMRAKKEAAVSGAVNEYDSQMTAMQSAMKALQKASEEDASRIVSLEETIERLQTQQREHEWEAKVVEQRQSHLHELRQRQEQNARVLQAYFRAYAARLEVDKEMASKNKKKKKGKKKK